MGSTKRLSKEEKIEKSVAPLKKNVEKPKDRIKYMPFEGNKFFFHLMVEATLVYFDGAVKKGTKTKKIVSGELSYKDRFEYLFPEDAIDFVCSGTYKLFFVQQSVKRGVETTLNGIKYFVWWKLKNEKKFMELPEEKAYSYFIMKAKRISDTRYKHYEEWKARTTFNFSISE